jgi:hypothetical protein
VRACTSATARLGRRCAAAIRSLSPAAALALTLAVIFGGAGVADAATGGRLILGHANSATSTTSLSSSRSVPLSLSAPKGKAPLSVSRNVMVKNLNAQLVGGLSAASLKLSGGDGFTQPNADIAISGDIFTVVAATGQLKAGIYYVTASALVDLTTGDTGATCVIEKKDNGLGGELASGGGDGVNFVQAAETVPVRVQNRAVLQELCLVQGSNEGTEVIDAGIFAIRVLSTSGTKPPTSGGLVVTGPAPAARHGRPASER